MNTLVCKDCKQSKSTTYFSPKKNSKTGYQDRCKECNSKKVSEYYKKNNYKEKYSERADRYRDQVKQVVDKIKSDYGCSCCGEKDAICLDFHHLDKTEKDFTVSQLTGAKNIPFLLEELKKCVVVCSNCHRKIHYGNLEIENPVVIIITEEEWYKLLPRSPRINNSDTLGYKIARRDREKTCKCVDCGKKCSKDSSRCRTCHNTIAGKDKPSKERLIKDFEELKTYASVARKYSVSDSNVRKWCKKYNWFPNKNS